MDLLRVILHNLHFCTELSSSAAPTVFQPRWYLARSVPWSLDGRLQVTGINSYKDPHSGWNDVTSHYRSMPRALGSTSMISGDDRLLLWRRCLTNRHYSCFIMTSSYLSFTWSRDLPVCKNLPLLLVSKVRSKDFQGVQSMSRSLLPQAPF